MTQTKAELLQTRHQGDIRLGDADSTHYVGFKAPATVGSNLVWTLPAADGTAGYYLKTDGSGNLGWSLDISGVSLSGSTNNTIATVTGANALQGEANLTFDGSELKLPTGSGTQGLFFQASSGANANLRGVGTNYGELGFFIGNSEKVRFDSSGRILAGLTSSTETNERLNITHPSDYQDNIITFSTQPNDTIGNASILKFRDKGGVSAQIKACGSAFGGGNDNALQFYTSTSSNNAPTLALTINESQNAVFAGSITTGNEDSSIGANLTVGNASTSDASITIGASATGNRNSYIDIIGDTTYTDYGVRLIRHTGGSNANSSIYHRGTGNFNFIAQEAAAIVFKTNDQSRLTLNSTGAATFTGTVSDSIGELRQIPSRSVSSVTLATSDVGKAILATSTVTVPNSTFSAGDAVTIINNSGGDITITKSISTMYLASDGSSANRTLATRGMATIWFASGTVAYISGAGLS